MSATEIPQAICEQAAGRLLQAGSIHAEHTVLHSKSQDQQFQLDQHSISLVQALGVREVTSRSGQAGVPIAGAEAAATK